MAVPVIGSPYVLEQWWTEFALRCQRCEPQPLIVLISDAVGVCPACGWRFQFVGFKFRGVALAPHELDLVIASVAPAKVGR